MTVTTMFLVSIAFTSGMLFGGRSLFLSVLGGVIAFCVAFTGWAGLYFAGQILIQLSQVQN